MKDGVRERAGQSRPRPHTGVRAGTRAAAVVCGALLLAGGVSYRTIAHYLDRAPASPLVPGVLGPLPLELGMWRGRDVPLAESVVRAAKVDDHISRIYTHPGQTVPITLFIALGARARDLMPHRPEVCYPGAGWTLQQRRTEILPASDGNDSEATMYTFGRGDLGGRSVVVLNFFVVDGQVCRDVSLLRSKAWRGQASIHYMCQVQVVAASEAWQATSAGAAAVREFAAELVPPLGRILGDLSTMKEMKQQLSTRDCGSDPVTARVAHPEQRP